MAKKPKEEVQGYIPGSGDPAEEGEAWERQLRANRAKAEAEKTHQDTGSLESLVRQNGVFIKELVSCMRPLAEAVKVSIDHQVHTGKSVIQMSNFLKDVLEKLHTLATSLPDKDKTVH